MLADMVREPLQMARLISVIDALEAVAGRVAETGSIDPEDVETLTDLVGHLEDFRPGKD